MSKTLCLCKSAEVTGLNGIILLCMDRAWGLSSLCAWSAEHNVASLQWENQLTLLSQAEAARFEAVHGL